MNETASQLERIAARAITLYSRPTVAMEVVQLTEKPCVDARAIKECVEKDPALTGKILRVVNSSLYGLATPVGDLNQALSLLGIKPLKLLVLGFSLPDTLYAEHEVRQLQWYWTNTLTRAVAARLISEQLWDHPGDEAFIAGLLQDIGILVLIRELGAPYARFLAGVIDEKRNLAALERDTLHFDHVDLSAALLARWRLPLRIIDAIAAPRHTPQLATMPPPESDLPQILHLADMLVEVIAQRRLHVLPHLMEAGEAYRDLTKRELLELVQQLQPQVEQLADVLSLELTADRDYVQTLVEAHERLGVLAEELAGALPSHSVDDPSYAALMEHSRELSEAMQLFLRCDRQIETEAAPGPRWAEQHAAHGQYSGRAPVALAGQVKDVPQLLRKLQFAGSRCRERRQELSLLLVEPNVTGVQADPGFAARQVRRAIGRACATLDQDAVTLVSLTPDRTAVILCNCERRAAVAIAQNAISQLGPRRTAQKQIAAPPAVTLSAGVATASGVPRNFDPTNMFESSERCLFAARAAGISAVKSIEV